MTHPSSWPGVAVRRTASLPLAYVPAIHAFGHRENQDVDARDERGHDGSPAEAIGISPRISDTPYRGIDPRLCLRIVFP
jgi:hypothetical protein